MINRDQDLIAREQTNGKIIGIGWGLIMGALFITTLIKLVLP